MKQTDHKQTNEMNQKSMDPKNSNKKQSGVSDNVADRAQQDGSSMGKGASTSTGKNTHDSADRTDKTQKSSNH